MRLILHEKIMSGVLTSQENLEWSFQSFQGAI